MLPIDDEWDAMTAKRDYGVGRAERQRKKSRDVISRYHHKKSIGDDDESRAMREQLISHAGVSFRERKFSM